MLIHGLGKKIGEIAASTAFDKIVRGNSGANASDTLKPDQKFRGAKTARKRRQRAKKG